MLASFPNCAVHNARSTTIYDATVKKTNAPSKTILTLSSPEHVLVNKTRQHSGSKMDIKKAKVVGWCVRVWGRGS